VSTTQQGNSQVIVVQPASPQVVYVPQYQPQQVYAPPPQRRPAGQAREMSLRHRYLIFGTGFAIGALISNNN